MSYQVFANNSEGLVYDSVGPQCELDSSGNVRQDAVYYQGQALYGNVPVPQVHSTNQSNRHQEPLSLSQLQQLWQLQRMQHISLQYQHAQPTNMAPVYHQQAPPPSMPLIAHPGCMVGGGFPAANRMEHTVRYTQDFTPTPAPTLGMMYTHGYGLYPPLGAAPVQSLPHSIGQYPPPSQRQFMRMPAAAYGLETFSNLMLPRDTNYTDALGQCNYQTPAAQQDSGAAAKGTDNGPAPSLQSCTEIQFEHWQPPVLDAEKEKEKENKFLRGEKDTEKGKGHGKGQREGQGKGKSRKHERSLPYYRHETQDAQRTA
ncbi:hypothetical protein BDQ12DRAFT_325758 [Crucibulum laeve]|uniref:Uncharacterized protein n=1 Tax=Crucibulum laeve TaxID=68775 RepID=A0A5C3LTA6_9AGAR|nr:hypothetical protein BDQ12DRAFT_325758 [Crucibulum laeve]